MEAYGDFARVYDELMDNIPYELWGERLDEMIQKYGVSKPERDVETALEAERNLVLDLGCGTGTMTEIMYARGYDMIGVDLSDDMLNIAMEKRERNGSQILYLEQDMRELELYGTVGTVFCLCDSINYILEEDELLQVFALVNNYLFPGGIFIFDFNTIHKYRDVMGDVTIAENRENCSFIWENYYDPSDGLNEYDLTLFLRETDGRFRRFSETHYQRGYDPGQMEELVMKSGMKVVASMDADTMGAVTGQSQRVYIVAREQGKRLNNA